MHVYRTCIHTLSHYTRSYTHTNTLISFIHIPAYNVQTHTRTLKNKKTVLKIFLVPNKSSNLVVKRDMNRKQVIRRISDFDIEKGTIIKQRTSFKYLGMTLFYDGRDTADISKKIGQVKRATRQLNSFIWNNNIAK